MSEPYLRLTPADSDVQLLLLSPLGSGASSLVPVQIINILNIKKIDGKICILIKFY
jgi:hypothetical protein